MKMLYSQNEALKENLRFKERLESKMLTLHPLVC